MKGSSVVKSLKRFGFTALVTVGLLVFVGCPPTLDDNQSPYLMFVSSIDPQQLGSKVCEELDPILGCVLIVDDKITVEVRAVMKSNLAETGTLAKIVLNRYRISFAKISGPAFQPEVPAPVEGGITATVDIGGTVAVELIAVPFWLKNEEPLLSLRETPFDIKPYELWCVGTVELWGTDLSGNTLQATGTFTVRFTNATLQD